MLNKSKRFIVKRLQSLVGSKWEEIRVVSPFCSEVTACARLILVIAALATGLPFCINSASAAQKTWNAASGTWDTSSMNWLTYGTTTPSVSFASGDDAVFSAATGDSALTLGTSVMAGNFDSNGVNTPGTTTITGVATYTLTLGTGTAGSGNIWDVTSTSDTPVAYAQNLTYILTGAGSAFSLASGSGTTATPSMWDIAPSKTFTVNATMAGQVADLGSNTVNIVGAGTVDFTSGVTLQNGIFNVNAGTLLFAGGSNRNTTINSSVTVNVGSAGTLSIAPNSGGGSTFSQVTNLNGGTLLFAGGTSANLSTVNLVSGTSIINISSTSGGPPIFTIGTLAGSGNATFTRTGSIGTLAVSGSNTGYSGNTTISSAILQANGSSDTLGTGAVSLTGGVLAGTGATGSGTITVSGGTISAGSGATSSSAVGTLNTAAQTWSSGTFVAKVNGTTGHDQLIMTGLTFAAGFKINLLGLTSSTTPFTNSNPTATTGGATPAVGSYIVLAEDTDTTASTNPFSSTNSASTVAALMLHFTTTSVPAYHTGDSIQLATESDGTGYDLVAEDVAAPEPTSMLLLGAVITPLLLGRRRSCIHRASSNS